ncbi:MAG: hypothetical protein E2O84_06060 [Bacteroidetes bacterium]|nr:MAG: hypothetical protein E2O84_06060 [Bacteroidota bacterium]
MSKTAMHFELALVETIQESLVSGQDLWVPGLGTFNVDHVAAQIRHDEDRDVLVIDPPRSIVTFSSSDDEGELPEFKSR